MSPSYERNSNATTLEPTKLIIPEKIILTPKGKELILPAISRAELPNSSKELEKYDFSRLYALNSRFINKFLEGVLSIDILDPEVTKKYTIEQMR
jgi:hypothetical protein